MQLPEASKSGCCLSEGGAAGIQVLFFEPCKLRSQEWSIIFSVAYEVPVMYCRKMCYKCLGKF